MVFEKLDAALFEQVKEESTKSLDRRREAMFWPSDASCERDMFVGMRLEGKCLRQLYWQYNKEPVTNITNPTWRLLAEAGTAFEATARESLKRVKNTDGSDFVVNNNVKFRFRPPGRKYRISGEYDFIFNDEENGIVGGECKTFGGYYMSKKIVNEGEPKPAHIMQCMIYLDSQRNKENGIKKWILFYSERGEHKQRREFVLELNGDRVVIDGKEDKTFSLKSIYDRYSLLQDHILRGELPDRDYELVWSEEEIRHQYAVGNLSKYKYDQWLKNAEPLGAAECSMLCPYRDKCWSIN